MLTLMFSLPCGVSLAVCMFSTSRWMLNCADHIHKSQYIQFDSHGDICVCSLIVSGPSNKLPRIHNEHCLLQSFRVFTIKTAHYKATADSQYKLLITKLPRIHNEHCLLQSYRGFTIKTAYYTKLPRIHNTNCL